MKEEEIKERVYDAIRKVAKTDEPEKFAEMNATAFEIAKKALEEISSCPTIEGWVARNKHGALIFFHSQPKRGLIEWVPITDYWMLLDRSLFPALRWEDEPKPVRVIIEEIK